MADLGHDAVFVEEAAALRPRLERCARVLYPGLDGDVGRADRAVDQALAKTYALGPDADRTISAFRALLHPTWRPTRSRRSGAERIELTDVAPMHTGDLAEELAALGPTSAAVVVLGLVGGLGPDELSRVVGAPKVRIAELFGDAVDRLGRRDPARRDHRELTRQLSRLAGESDPLATSRAGVGDLARGRRLEQRGRRRRAALAGAAGVVVALVAGLAIRVGDQGEIANVPTPAPTPAPSFVSDPWRSYRCDAGDPDCRTIRTARWRSRIAGVIVQHLDPKRTYFSDMTFGIRNGFESEAFWAGRDGALALTVSREGDGSTEVSLQIATSRAVADRCGRATKQRCQPITFMNGSRYLIAGTSTGEGGVEIQYAAAAGQVITVVARDVSSGKKLDIDTGDLVQLVEDSRVRLPRR